MPAEHMPSRFIAILLSNRPCFASKKTMSNKTKVKWQFEADYLQACNCDYGCPCEFEAPPTQGFCQGIGAWKIRRGRYGELKLDGLGLGFAGHTPGPMHKGSGTFVAFIDKKANAGQRDALAAIAHGRAAGMPFEIFALIASKWLEPHYVNFQFKLAGRNSSVKIGNLVTIALEPIKNPATGTPEQIRVNHGTGFIFKEAEVVSAKSCKATVDGERVLNFSWPARAGFVCRVKYSN